MAAGWTSRYYLFFFSEVSDINFLPMEFLRSKVRGGNHVKCFLLKTIPPPQKNRCSQNFPPTTSPKKSLKRSFLPRPIDTNPKVSICGKWLQYGPLCVVPWEAKKIRLDLYGERIRDFLWFFSRMQIHFMEGWKWVGSLYNSGHFLLAMTLFFEGLFPQSSRPKFQPKQGAPLKGSRWLWEERVVNRIQD